MLTDTERAMLQLEARPWRYAGAKETAIRGAFGWSPTAYAQRLAVLLDTERALAHDPVLVNRLRRHRDARTTRRRAA